MSLGWRGKWPSSRSALARDGAYLLRSNQGGWTAESSGKRICNWRRWNALSGVLKSELLLRPIWHHYSGRTQAHVFICVLAYALWKTLDHLAKRAGLNADWQTRPGPQANAAPKPRPMTPEVILRDCRHLIGDIELQATDGRRLIFRRVARPNAEQKRILKPWASRCPNA